MELRELAEQVLFATSLEAKLHCPEVISDLRPGSPFAAPAAPSRPAELQFKSSDSGPVDFPRLGLSEKNERGRVLHFFANHELLATELMALVLLRFPDAPAPFRRGVFQTLRDEQLHTRLYLARMRECGIEFGELPVSGYFWRSVANMRSPMDYVAGLSLTFEQANLDFCRQFARAFQSAGDSDTAQLLERIYRDEIGHVAYGLKWFRRWKNPQQSDWQAFCGQLKFPLSPQRAKGGTLNVEGRRAAGFDPEFIGELSVYSKSRGRTPRVFWFNPLSEGCIAQGKSFTPVKHQLLLAADLANLPQYLSRQDDIVVLPQRPAIKFLTAIRAAGFPLPEFVESDPAGSGVLSLGSRKLGGLAPWAWGPDSVRFFQPLFDNVTVAKRSPSEYFNGKIARLYSKTWSADLLRQVLASTPEQPWLCVQKEVGVAAAGEPTVIEAITRIRQGGHHRIVIKEAHGLAGHNSIRLWEPELLAAQRRWIERSLRGEREVIVEPWLERVIDFSIQLEMKPSGLSLCGYTGLINDHRGQFQANWAAPDYHRRLPLKVLSCFLPVLDISTRIHQFYARVFSALETELVEAAYVGPVSIDAFVYRAPQGECRLKPIVEINPRYTMGRLTLELMKQAAPGRQGLFRLVSRAMVHAKGFEDFVSYAENLGQKFPVRLHGLPVPKIDEGILPLNDPAAAKVCLALFQVSKNLELEDALSIPF
jgi:uncharacterized ferritin-like protein (DUF455 family)